MLGDGNYHVYATTIDPKSHLAFSSNSVNVRIKTESYIEPTINTPDVNQFFDTEDIPTIGSAEPNAPVLLFLNSKFVGKTEASSAGNWEYRFNDLSDGKYFLNVVGLDNEGHVNKKSPGVNFYVDRKPVNPKITTPKDNQKIDTDNIQVSGTAKPFAKVAFMINNKELPGTVTADNDGNWDVKLTDLSEQEYKLQAVAHGAKKLTSNVVSFNVAKPSKEQPQKVAQQAENQEAPQNAVGSINGKSKPNENGKLFMNGYHLADLQSNDQGIWNHPINFNNLDEGEHKIQYVAVDNNNKTQLIIEKPISVDNKQSW